MNLAALCLKNSRTAWVFFALLALAGVCSYWSMPRLEDPTFTIRQAVVVTVYPGAAPEKVEKLVTDKLEERIREMGEVETITSQSMAGLSVLYVNVYEHLTDMQPIWQRLRNKVRDTIPNLPQGARQPVVNDEFGDVYGILLCLTGEGYVNSELKDMAEEVRDELITVPDVAKVLLHGVQDERIFIEFSNSRLAELGLPPRQLAAQLQRQNSLQPSGEILLGPERVILESTGEFTNLEALRRALIHIPGKAETVMLGEVADISRGYADPPREMVRYQGEKSILLALSMVEDGNIVRLGQRIKDKMPEIKTMLPVGMDLDIFMFQPDHVQEAITDFTRNLLQAFVFVVLVMFAFVGWRTGAVAGLLVPMAMLGAVAVMRILGVKLHIVSIGALIISLGILVDNGVVVSENILVQMSRGMEQTKAAIQAVHRLWMPLLSASLTTIFVFLPIPLAQSMTGEYTSSLFTVVTVTLLMSWLLAMSFVPLLSSSMLSAPTKQTQSRQRAIYNLYARFLQVCLCRPKLFLLGVAVLMGLSVWGFTFVPSMFFPPNEREIVVIDFWQPYGTDIQATRDRVARLETWLEEQDEVQDVGSFVGFGGPRWYLAMEPEQFKPNYAFCIVRTRSEEQTWILRKRAENAIQTDFPDSRASVRLLERGPPVGAPIQVRISGDKQKILYSLRDRIEAHIAGLQGITSVWDDWGEWSKKLVLNVDQYRAKKAGLSSEDIAVSLYGHFSGLEISEYRQGEDLIPIILRSTDDVRHDPEGLAGAQIYSPDHQESVSLGQVARPTLKWQPGNIRHRDCRRTLTVKADVAPGFFPSHILHEQITPWLSKMQDSKKWPWGYDIAYGGEYEESERANRSIMVNVPLALGLIAFILIVQFNSLRRVGVILLTLPPAMIGVVAGMLLTSSPFGFMALLGMISLVGIIVNNAIMMIDQIEIERETRDNAVQAVLEAAKMRLRPIVMTACTTILGLLPLALQGGELWRPMANVLMFGLAFSTLLTLFLCPVLYVLVFGLNPGSRRLQPDG
ncbi:MAG: efflux RND transporter permease subunit [Desulfovermiculus sp.]